MVSTSRLLFLAAGLLWTVIGLLAPVMMDTTAGKRTLFGSPTTDKALYRAAPEELLVSNLDLAIFRQVILRAIAGLLVATGLLTAAVAWFGLRQPETWALTLLTGVGLVVLPYWWIAFGPYREAGIDLGVLDLPPFMWIAALLMAAAAALGWVGYWRGS
jgi:hypothetical protein